jgi:adenylate cyclase
MEDATLATIRAWITEAGLMGTSEIALLRGCCQWLVAAGVPVSRATALMDTLHPVHEGRVFRWRAAEGQVEEIFEYGRMAENAEAEAGWLQSPFHHLLETGGTVLRRNAARGDPADFSFIAEAHAQGQTDYAAIIQRFSDAGSLGEMDCCYTSWMTEAPQGFDDADVAALEALVPTLALAIKAASLQRIAGTLMETYLGRDAGRRVLAGRIARGVADRVNTVLWWSDLRGFTRVSDTAPPDQIIPMLNDYAEAVISAIHEAGGDVLKLIGDGTLAVFAAAEPENACRAALAAEAKARTRVAEVNANRTAAGLPVTDVYLALHIGDVFYGNIGARERLDFTVIGPAVNMVNRIATMCRSVERPVLLSSQFVAAAGGAGGEIVSVGRYALRGFEAAEELFTVVRG